MASPDAAIERWFAVQRGQSSRYLSCRNVVSDDRALYSYGYHFPMVQPVKDKHGQRMFWLLNGDVASVTTSKQQGMVRGHLRGDLSVTIPFSVLEAAGIDKQSVRLLEATQDRWVTTLNSTPEMPPRAHWDGFWRTEHIPFTDEEMLAYAEAQYCKQVQDHVDGLARGADFYQRGLDELLRYTPLEWMDVHGGYHWQYQMYRKVNISYVNYLYHGHRKLDVVDTADGPRYEWISERHWLGESLIEGRVPGPTRKLTCKACGGTGWSMVGTAETGWRGELFPLGRCGVCRSGKVHQQTWRTAKFLSGFDRNETRPSYFFCELPTTDASTVEEALDALKPRAVQLAEQMGRNVARQGDIFAIEQPSVTRKTLKAQGATFRTRKGGRTVVNGVVTATVEVSELLGTNHVATESATLPDGTLYARGCLYHSPGFRAPDHARCKLPDGWSLIVKNTVPLTK